MVKKPLSRLAFCKNQAFSGEKQLLQAAESVACFAMKDQLHAEDAIARERVGP
jgi:hypothetical protein